MIKKKEKEVRRYILIDDNTPFDIVESFRNLKNNITFSIPEKMEKKAKIFFVTSTKTMEGKSTIAINTAIMFAKANVKTLVIDCDLRKPSINKYFNETAKEGLSAYLSGQLAISKLVKNSGIENLSIVFSGAIPPNPQELLSSEKMNSFLDEMSTQYDCIVIDTPPVGTVSDCLVIAPKVDGCILVAKQSNTHRDELVDSIKKLNFAKCKILGTVLNCVSRTKDNKYYKSKYGYGEYK